MDDGPLPGVVQPIPDVSLSVPRSNAQDRSRQPVPHHAIDPVALTIQAYADHLEDCVRQWQRRRHRRPPWLRVLLERIPSSPGLLVDLGCGLCQDLIRLERDGRHGVGVDIFGSFLLRGRGARRLRLIQADMRALPFQPRAFDGVWAAASLIHLPKRDVGRVLRDVSRLVKPTGMLAATFLHGRRSGRLHAGWVPGRYLSRWLKDELRVTVQRCGWVVHQLEVVVNQERKGRWINLLASPSGKSARVNTVCGSRQPR